MTATWVLLRSIYDCNLGHVEVQIWVQSWFQKGPNMTAIVFGREQIWVQSRKSRWALLTLISGRISSRGTFQLLHSYLFPNRNDCSHIWPLLKSRLHSYLDLNVTKIAIINGPQQNPDCSHIWTLLKLRLQSYLDPNMSDISLIIGPPYIIQSLTKIPIITPIYFRA